MVVTPSSGLTADGAGLLSFDNAGRAVGGIVPKWLSAQWTSSGQQLSGLGGPLLQYQVLARTNLLTPVRTTVGTVTADTSGALQFLDSAATNSGRRFYRLVR